MLENPPRLLFRGKVQDGVSTGLPVELRGCGGSGVDDGATATTTAAAIETGGGIVWGQRDCGQPRK